MAKFYSARSEIIPPLPWITFALPFSACFVLLMAWKAPPWAVVIVAAGGGVGLALIP